MGNTVFKCKNCGGEVAPDGAENGVLRCIYCNGIFTVPRQNADPMAIASLRIGESNLDSCRFDDAYTAYQKAASLSPDEPEAYFGMALANAKVQYLKDIVNGGRLQPIVYEITDKSFQKDKNYLKALGLASSAQKTEYEKKAKEIDEIRRKFFDLKSAGLDYDCFICTKVSAEDGGHTEDSHIAAKLYHRLKEEGFKPFYSEEETRGRTGSDYEALILYALYSSESMLLVCTDESYLQTPWVKNEYTRFLKMMREDEKQSDSLTFVFDETPVERLPGVDGKIQGVPFRSYDALERIKEFVKRHAGRVSQLKRKSYGGNNYQKKAAIRQTVEKRKLDSLGGGEISVSDQSKLKIVIDFMNRSDFANAIRFCDGLITSNPSNGEAYWYKFLAENNCRDGQNFVGTPTVKNDFTNLEKAIAATPDKRRRQEFYKVLADHVEKHKDFACYKEYIELPESDEAKIESLTRFIYKRALEEKNESLFDFALKTVTDADLYIDMNLEFARAIGGTNAVKYYRNILTVDESDYEAQWFAFEAECGKNLFAFCADEKNHSVLEEKLFSFGFNDYACDRLIDMGIDSSDTAKACKILDFVLTMIPKEESELYSKLLGEVVDKLFRSKKPEAAKKYNEMLVAADPYDHAAYFNRCLIKHGLSNPLGLMKYSDKLLEDEDYLAAVNSYTEKFPHKSKNLYLDIRDAFDDLKRDKAIRKGYGYAVKNIFVEREQIPTCKATVKGGIGDKKESNGEKLRKCVLFIGSPVVILFAVALFLGLAGVSRLNEFFYCLFSLNKVAIPIVGVLVFVIPVVGAIAYAVHRYSKSKSYSKLSCLLVSASLIAAIVSSATGIGMFAAAKAEKSSVFVGDGYVLQLKLANSGEEYTITNCVNSTDTIVLPASYNGIPVTKIGRHLGDNGHNQGAFQGNEKLVSVTIPKSIKTFGEGAFAYCVNLRHIYYEGTKEDWGQIAFEGGGWFDTKWNEGMKSYAVYYADGENS